MTNYHDWSQAAKLRSAHFSKTPQQCKREIPAPSTPYQHLHKGMLNYSLIIRESPCGRRMTRTPAANWHINNPACLWWRGSRSQCRNLLSASTFCLTASTVCRRIRIRRHTCSAVSWLIGRRHAGLLLLRLLRVAPVLMLYISSWCRYVMSSHQLILVCCCKKRESFLLSILSSLEKNIWKSLCTSEGCVNTTQSCRQSVEVKFENFSSIAKVTVVTQITDLKSRYVSGNGFRSLSDLRYSNYRKHSRKQCGSLNWFSFYIFTKLFFRCC